MKVSWSKFSTDYCLHSSKITARPKTADCAFFRENESLLCDRLLKLKINKEK